MINSLDELLKEVGGFGPYQLYIFLGILLPYMPVGWSMMQMQFVGMVPDFYCIGESSDNVSVGGMRNVSNSTLNVCFLDGKSCSVHLFVSSYSTAVSEWDLVCDRHWIKKLLESLQMIGATVGAVLVAQLSDWFGRRKIYYAFLVLHGASNIFSAFSFNWQMFAVGRFLVGFCLGAILSVGLPYIIEFIPRRWRSSIQLFPSFTIGVMVYAGMAALLKDWFYLHIAVALFTIVFLPGFFLFPEGIRWLTVNGEISKAEKIIETIARWNKKPVPEDLTTLLKHIAALSKDSDSKTNKYSYVDVFRGWRIFKVSSASGFVMLFSSIAYYGVTFEVSALAGNVFLNIFLMALISIPNILSTVCMSNVFGRRCASLSYFAISSAAFLTCIVLLTVTPHSTVTSYLVESLNIVAVVGIESAWTIFSIWILEVYPTVIRNAGYGYTGSMGRIGSAVAPFVIDLCGRKYLSLIILGAMSCLCCCLLFALPETKDRDMADVLTDTTSASRAEPRESDVLTDTTSASRAEPRESDGLSRESRPRYGAIHSPRESEVTSSHADMIS